MVREEVYFLVSVIELLMRHSDLQRTNQTIPKGAISYKQPFHTEQFISFDYAIHLSVF